MLLTVVYTYRDFKRDPFLSVLSLIDNYSGLVIHVVFVVVVVCGDL